MLKSMVSVFKDLSGSAVRVMRYGISFSLGLLSLCAVISCINLFMLLDPDITYYNTVLTESAVSIFPFSIGAGLLLDYLIKRRADE